MVVRHERVRGWSGKLGILSFLASFHVTAAVMTYTAEVGRRWALIYTVGTWVFALLVCASFGIGILIVLRSEEPSVERGRAFRWTLAALFSFALQAFFWQIALFGPIQ